MRFSLTRQQHDEVVTLAPVAEREAGAVDALRSSVQDALSTTHRVDVVVGLARVTFLDCAGIDALVAGRYTAVNQGCGYAVVNPERQVRRVVELTGVVIAPDRASAGGTGGRASTAARRSGRHRDDRPVAAGPPAPSTAGVLASDTNRSW